MHMRGICFASRFRIRLSSAYVALCLSFDPSSIQVKGAIRIIQFKCFLILSNEATVAQNRFHQRLNFSVGGPKMYDSHLQLVNRHYSPPDSMLGKVSKHVTSRPNALTTCQAVSILRCIVSKI